MAGYMLLTGLLSKWPNALLLIKPETVLRWHREGFRQFWRWKCRPSGPREPRIALHVVALIHRMTTAPQRKSCGRPKEPTQLKACRQLGATRLLHADDGRELMPKMVKVWVMRAERRAGLPETGRLHIYRHTFASHLAMAGVPAKTIQELARHRSFAATMRYMHLTPSAKDEGIAMLVQSRQEGGRSVAVGAPSAGATVGATGASTRQSAVK